MREALGISGGDRVTVRVEGGKAVIEKVSEDIWLDCTNFLPEDFEKVLRRLRTDYRKRLKQLGTVSAPSINT